jgi:hypothetical protein
MAGSGTPLQMIINVLFRKGAITKVEADKVLVHKKEGQNGEVILVLLLLSSDRRQSVAFALDYWQRLAKRCL